MALNGIDISGWQGTIDLSKVPCDFVIVKATGGTKFKNAYFNKQIDQALKLGKKVGCYHYARENGYQGTAKQEADYFYNNVKKYIGKAVLALDWEQELTLGPAWAKEWLDRVYELSGVRPLLYTSQSVLNAYNWEKVAGAGYGLWMAQYANMLPCYGYATNPWRNGGIGAFKLLAIHQYSGNGRLSGYPYPLDLDIFYGDKTAWDKYAKSTKKAAATKPKPQASKPINNGSGKSYEAFKKMYLGKAVDVDGYYGPQCWDLVSGKYFPYIGGKVIRCGISGYAKDIYTQRATNGILTFTKNIGLHAILQPGDICVWGDCIACPKSHIAIYDHDKGQSHVFFFGQNQGGYGCTVKEIPVNGIIGVFRPNIFIK